MNIKVWWVVAWNTYYPDEELGNVIETFYTEESAISFQQDVKQNGHHITYQYDGKDIEYTMEYDHVEVIDVSDKLGLGDERT
jgi:hypothetical protein